MPPAAYLPSMEAIGTQTEMLHQREVAVGDGDTDAGPPERNIPLQLQLPTPQDFPILTVAQLLEAEQRTLALIQRLEQAILQAAQEEHDQQRLARIAAGLDDDQTKKLMRTDEWLERMGHKIDERLRRTHRDPEGVSLPTFWVRSKIDDIPNPASPFRSRDGRRIKPVARTVDAVTPSPERKQRKPCKWANFTLDAIKKPAATSTSASGAAGRTSSASPSRRLAH